VKAVPTGRSLGLLVCLQCRATVRALQVAYPRCPRCYAHLYQRKPHSLALTAALLICAAILYIPANVLPVMYTRTIFDDEEDTIMSGVLVLLHSSWPIAVLVFIASIVVPLLKILSLGVVVFSAWRR
jgi:paraquat-inducible protein A